MSDIYKLIQVFNQTFADSDNVRLVKGHDEPIYLPPHHSEGEGSTFIAAQPYAQVVFAHGFFASALHEVAHWCLAGTERRKKVDYGYWYSPDGRTAEQQALFQSVEIKPQAIEWAFSASANVPFRVSCDNLSGDEHGRQPDRLAFEQQVTVQLKHYLKEGFPTRAQQFIFAIQTAFLPQQLDEAVLDKKTGLNLDTCLAVLNRKNEECSHDSAA